MYQRDYIMRIIEQMTVMIGKIGGLRAVGKYDEALSVLEEMLRRTTRLHSDLLRSLPERELVAMFEWNGELELGKLWVVATCLREEGAVYRELGDEDKWFQSGSIALNLFFIISSYEDAPLNDDDLVMIDQLVKELQAYELSTITMLRMIAYLEFRGQWSKAEDLLFELQEVWTEQRQQTEREISQIYNAELYALDLRVWGEYFYRRLKAIPDEKLAAGGLPKDEVEAGARAWSGVWIDG